MKENITKFLESRANRISCDRRYSASTWDYAIIGFSICVDITNAVKDIALAINNSQINLGSRVGNTDKCRWVEGIEGFWKTDCECSFCASDGSPPKNHGFEFCPYCGGRIAFEAIESESWD